MPPRRQVETADLVEQARRAALCQECLAEIAARAGDAELRSGGCDAAMPPARRSIRRRTRSAMPISRPTENGIVTAVNADVGQVVGAGTPVMTVAVDGEKEVLIAVPEMDIAEFKPGKDGQGAASGPTTRWCSTARCVKLPAAPTSSRAPLRSASACRRSARAARHDANDRGRVGQRQQAMVSIPLSALAEKDGQQDRLDRRPRRRRPCTPAPSRSPTSPATASVSTEGLKPGDVVVSAGTQFMTENLKVKLPRACNEPGCATT